MSDARNIRFRIEPNGSELTLTGRDAWALSELHKAGGQGVTPFVVPGPRWSGYVHNLRKLGVVIETIHEKHGGPFPGTHARYVLRSQISIFENGRAAA